jgi:hypothetical protein
MPGIVGSLQPIKNGNNAIAVQTAGVIFSTFMFVGISSRRS